MRKTALVCCLAACSSGAHAEHRLSGAEIAKLVSDRTFEVSYVKFNAELRMLFAADGKATAVSKQGTRRGGWRIDPEDRFCLHWANRPETCSLLFALDNGTYKLVANDETHTFWVDAACDK